MIPTIRHFECFVAVAAELNFRRAAKRCHMTQPSLSAQIRQLEELLGIPLFERGRTAVSLTAGGAALLPRARHILEETREFSAAAKALGDPLHGKLRLGSIPTVAPYLVPDMVASIREHFPHVELSVTEDTTPRLVEALLAGDVDVLLLALEAGLQEAETSPIIHDPFYVAVSDDHRFTAQDEVLSRQLNCEAVLLLEDGH